MINSSDIENLTDEEILAKYKTGNNQQYLGILLDRYISFVLLIASKYLKDKDLAKDMAMQVFEKVINDVGRFEISNFKSWLHVVTKNQCLMYIRSHKNQQHISLEPNFLLNHDVENKLIVHHDDEEDKEHKLLELEKAVEQLDTNQRRCIELFFIEERSYKEIVDLTGYSLNEVKSYIQNGKRNLRNILVGKDIMLYLFISLFLFK